MNGRYIISRFGGQTALARVLGKSQSTVSYWAKNDEIPGRYWSQLLDLAKGQGLALTMEDFIAARPQVPMEPSPPDALLSPDEVEVSPSQTAAEPGMALEALAPDASRFLLYRGESGNVQVRVLIQDESAWASQRGMAEIFDVSIPTINHHLQNIIYRESELDESVIRKSLITAPDGKTYETNFYSLDAIISVGYRVNSYRATQFRRWATTVLRSYMIKGFALDDERLKQGKHVFGKDYFDELFERIREIRASERRFYQKITDIFAQCSIDYDKESPVCKQFYAHVQDKLHYAICQQTAAEIIDSRADASKPNMGLTNWRNEAKGGKVTKADVTVGKSYLSVDEMGELNRLVSMYLDSAENFARRQVALTMKDWAERLDAFLRFNAYEVLEGFGRVSRDVADRHAIAEYEKYRVIQDVDFKSDFDKVVEQVRVDKRLPNTIE